MSLNYPEEEMWVVQSKINTSRLQDIILEENLGDLGRPKEWN